MVAASADDLPPLVISSYTLGEQISFADRVRVAAEAGFVGIGLRAENYADVDGEGLDDARMKAILDRHAIAVMEVEYLTGWGSDHRDEAQQRKEQTIFHLARTFGVGHLNAGLLEKLPVDAVGDAFAELCRRAGDLIVVLEFMPYSGVPDLATAWDVLRRAAQPNSGLLVDAWHWARAGMTPDDLVGVPAERIMAIQLCDVGEYPMDPLRQESLHHRLPPGEGFGDVVGMLTALRAKGVDAMMSVEVMSDELLSRGPEVAAATVIAAARNVLLAVG